MVPKFSLLLPAVLLAAACAAPSNSTPGPTEAESSGGLVLQKLNLTGTVSTLSGHPDGGTVNVDGAAGTAVFRGPIQLATDGTFLYATDQDAHAIRRISLADGSVATIAGGLARTAGDEVGTGAQARFELPTGIVYLKNSLYIADYENQKVKKLDLATGVVSLVAGTKGATTSADGVGTKAHFIRPTGITTDGTFLYVCDSSEPLIRKIDPATGAVTTIVGLEGGLSGPRALATDGKVLYVADTSQYLIRKVDLNTLAMTTIAGSKDGVGPATGPANQVGLGFCEGLITDGTDLYFSESTNNQVFRLDLAASTISLVAGGGGTFNYPAGLVSDGTALYVADYTGQAVRMIR